MKTYTLPSPGDVLHGAALALAGLVCMFGWAFLISFGSTMALPYALITYGTLVLAGEARRLISQPEVLPAATEPLSPRTTPPVPYATFDAWVTRDGRVYFGGQEPMVRVSA